MENVRREHGILDVRGGRVRGEGRALPPVLRGRWQPFKNFHLKVEVMTGPGSNGGIFFHTAYREKDWPRAGFECQVNVTRKDWIKTGSLYGLANIGSVVRYRNIRVKRI